MKFSRSDFLKRVKYEGRSKTARYRANSVRRSRRSVPAAPSCAQNQNEHTPFEVGGPELGADPGRRLVAQSIAPTETPAKRCSRFGVIQGDLFD